MKLSYKLKANQLLCACSNMLLPICIFGVFLLILSSQLCDTCGTSQAAGSYSAWGTSTPAHSGSASQGTGSCCSNAGLLCSSSPEGSSAAGSCCQLPPWLKAQRWLLHHFGTGWQECSTAGVENGQDIPLI